MFIVVADHQVKATTTMDQAAATTGHSSHTRRSLLTWSTQKFNSEVLVRAHQKKQEAIHQAYMRNILAGEQFDPVYLEKMKADDQAFLEKIKADDQACLEKMKADDQAYLEKMEADDQAFLEKRRRPRERNSKPLVPSVASLDAATPLAGTSDDQQVPSVEGVPLESATPLVGQEGCDVSQSGCEDQVVPLTTPTPSPGADLPPSSLPPSPGTPMTDPVAEVPSPTAANPEQTPTRQVTPTATSPMSPLSFQQGCDVSPSDDQVVPITPSPKAMKVHANSLPPSPGTPAKEPGQAQLSAEVQGEVVQDHQGLVDEVRRLKAVVKERDHALADRTAQLQQHSFWLAQRDTELMHTHFQLRPVRASLQYYSPHPQHQQQLHMAEMHRVMQRDRQEFQQHLHCLQDQVDFLQNELHAVNTHQRVLQADCQQLQQQREALETERSQDERHRYAQTQKFRAQLREQQEAHEAETAIFHVAYRKLLTTTVERGQMICELQTKCHSETARCRTTVMSLIPRSQVSRLTS